MHSPAPLHAYTRKFEELFPYYLSIGMTYEQFWKQDCELVKFYRKAAEIRQDVRNQDMWLQGLYFYEALVKASPAFRSMGASKPQPYRSEPFPLAVSKNRQVEIEAASDNRARAMMEAFAIEHNRKFKKKGGGMDG